MKIRQTLKKQKAYENVQEEIDQHMGKEPSKAMMKDFDKQNKEDIIADMQKFLRLILIVV